MKALKSLAMFAMALCVMACSEEEPTSPIAGTYEGTNTTVVTSPIFPTQTTTAAGKVQVKAQAEGLVTVVLLADENNEGAKKGGMVMPTLEVKNVKVADGADGSYTLKLDSINMMVNGTNYVGKKGLTGTVKGNKMNLEYAVVPGQMPGLITVTFDGAKK